MRKQSGTPKFRDNAHRDGKRSHAAKSRTKARKRQRALKQERSGR